RMSSHMLSSYIFVFLFFFFFQAEDGIRDFHVTGVQTCALPISSGAGGAAAARLTRAGLAGGARDVRGDICRAQSCPSSAGRAARSEERRVGKECRSRWWP